MLQEGKVKGWSRDTVTVRGDLPYALEIDYKLNDELLSFVEDEDYWVNSHGKYKLQISENYRELHVSAGRVVKTEDGLYEAFVYECILHPTKQWMEWNGSMIVYPNKNRRKNYETR